MIYTNIMNEWFCYSENKILLKLVLIPGARKSELIGPYGDPARLKIKIASPPVDGAANKELIKFLAKVLAISKSSITIIRGLTARQKDIEIAVLTKDVKGHQEKLYLLIDKKSQ